MYRDGLQFIDEKPMNFVLNHGALGDVITSLPAIIAARKMYDPAQKMRVWAPSWLNELVGHLLAPYGEFETLRFEDFPMTRVERENWDGGHTALNAPPHNVHTRNRVHMVDFAFNFLLDSQPESMAERNYPTAAPFGDRLVLGKYVVFPVGAATENRTFRASVMTPVLRWVLESGYTPVIVGTKTSFVKALSGDGKVEPIILRDEADKIPTDIVGFCRDLREKTTLLQLRDICGDAAAVVGLDGGTLHLAGTTNTNIIYALTTALPKHRYIVRYSNPNHKIRYVGPRDLECAGCQSNWRMSRQDFRFCAYGDSLCVDRLHPEDFIHGLEELGV